ncbi:MAG: purine-nucleoside phosphorylase, partial [Clostridia bacterium]|nr:purine-nucleoside phosphorylase [Clostridia bacterium]
EARKLSHHVGNLLSSDVFYGDDPTSSQKWGKMGVLAVEMEAAALYMNAARAGRRALAICTVSDHLLTGEATSSEERQTSFTQMMEVALETAVAAESFS